MEFTKRSLVNIFLILVIFLVWICVHELLHAAAMVGLGYSVQLNLGLPVSITCVGCPNTFEEVLIIGSLPYVAEIMGLAAIYFRKRSFWAFWIGNTLFLDFASNVLGFLVSGYMSIVNDFRNIVLAGYWFIVVAIFIVTPLLWYAANVSRNTVWSSHKRLLQEVLKELGC